MQTECGRNAHGHHSNGAPTTTEVSEANTRIIDLRSDTITCPTAAMRAIIASASVGDDLYREDPTVHELETYCATLFGKEAAIFMPTGTMSNQIALRCLVEPGGEAILDASYHIHFFESAQSACLAGVTLNSCTTIDGVLTVDDVEKAWLCKPRGFGYAVPRLLCIENTVNAAGGRVFPLAAIRELRCFADQRKIAIHMDGARLWNACVATGIAPSEYCRDVDTVSVCMAKGLGAPAGSVLLGSAEVIQTARRYRKWYGGSLHQAGILAAAALFGLRNHQARLVDDHANARTLAVGLARMIEPAIAVSAVETNIVMLDVTLFGMSAATFAERARAENLLVMPWLPNVVRMVTHLDVDRVDVEDALQRLERVITAVRQAT
ncbi:threonine aldolase [Bradyrhizobium sp. USDA 4011]